jgi:hypothetical protein
MLTRNVPLLIPDLRSDKESWVVLGMKDGTLGSSSTAPGARSEHRLHHGDMKALPAAEGCAAVVEAPGRFQAGFERVSPIAGQPHDP